MFITQPSFFCLIQAFSQLGYSVKSGLSLHCWLCLSQWLNFISNRIRGKATEGAYYLVNVCLWLLENQIVRVKRRCRRNNQSHPRIEHCDWFIFLLLLPTPAIRFLPVLPDHECNGHKWNGCSASDSIGFILTRLYRSVLLIMTLVMTLNTKKRLFLLPYATQLSARMKPGCDISTRPLAQVSVKSGEYEYKYDFHCQEII